MSVRTDFSLGESSLQIDKLVKRAVELGYECVAVTDTMTLSGMPLLFEKAKKANLKAMVGCVVRVVDDPAARVKDREQGGYRLKVFPKTERGLQSLFKLLSLGLQQDHFYYHSRVSLQEVLDTLEECAVTTGDLHNVFHSEDYQVICSRLAVRFGADFYIETVALNTPLFDKLNARALATWHDMDGMPDMLATRPVFYETIEDADSCDVLRAIATNTPTDSIFLPRPYVRSMALQTSKDFVDQAWAMFCRLESDPVKAKAWLRHALSGIEDLVASCTYEYKKLPPSLPKLAENEFVELTKRVGEGWRERFARKVWGHAPTPEDLPVYKERLAYELQVLKKLNFSGYFLLVQEIVRWSKAQGILVGPGRGSVGGSLVAYLMGITDIDPIRFDLLFERFINPDRIDLPDADLDFSSRRRHEIVQMIIERFGADKVCGIVNFNTLGPASAIRDVARLHGLSPIDYSCSKLVEKEHGVAVELAETVRTVPEIERFSEEHPVVWEHALRLEGANRGLGRHAAGVVIAAEPVVNRGVIGTQAGPDQAVVQWDKSRVEDFGLIKIDVLGLNTLDTIAAITRYIKERHHKTIDTLALPLDDPKVLAAFARGDTTGVFQFEGGGMKKLLKELAEGGVLSFDDICAATALFRPGPLDAGLCDRYVAVKKGEIEPTYEHPALEECLSDTFGVLVYQEQVMKLTRVLCGFTPGEADGVRKAIGKKDAEKMAEFEEKFVAGAVANGMGEIAAKALWDMILGFAGYAFNKSHSYEYSLISWVTMWLKVYYPAEFYAGALSVVEDEDKQASLIADAQSKGLKILPPDILVSTDRIEIEGEDTLYAPFQAVKGISEGTAQAIVQLRKVAGGKLTWEPAKRVMRRRKNKDTGKFEQKEELDPGHVVEFSGAVQTEVLGRTKVNARAIESLDKVGSFYKIAGGLAPMHPDRLRDRLELMPGFTVEVVKADRRLVVEDFAKIQIVTMFKAVQACEGCSLKDRKHPVIKMGAKPRFMMVFDSPSWKEAKEGELLVGDTAAVIKQGLHDVGLKVVDGYFTTLVKGDKPKEQKALTNEQINGCTQWLKRELEILKPPVIVAMGSNAVRFFAPGVKGTPADLAGKVFYRSDLDATVIFGINPASIYFDHSKVALVEAAFAKLAEALS